MRALYAKNKTTTPGHGFTETTVNPKQLAFIEKFSKRFGEKPTPDSAFTYDDIFVLAQALKPCVSASEVNEQCTVDKLLKTDYDGAAGRLTFSAKGVSTRDVLLVQIKNGQWVEVTK